MTRLRGITWDHPRAYEPLRALAASFLEATGHRVDWEIRTLQDFADFPLSRLAQEYDLVVFDHPFVGDAAREGYLLPLDEVLGVTPLAELGKSSVGASHASYERDGHQWAVAVDAACHVSAYRRDLLGRMGCEVPGTWPDLLQLGEMLRGLGLWLAVPLKPVDCFCAFVTLCANFGEPPFQGDGVVSRTAGLQALDLLTKLRLIAHPDSGTLNPIQLLDRMADGDDIVFAPMVFGYNNYSRTGFRRHVVQFEALPSAGIGPVGLLGGAGLGISATTAFQGVAATFVSYCASEAAQRIAANEGGQPGYRAPWLSEEINERCGGFFQATLQSMDCAYLRPRYPGFVELQTQVGELLHQYLVQGNGTASEVLDEMDDRHRRCLQSAGLTLT